MNFHKVNIPVYQALRTSKTLLAAPRSFLYAFSNQFLTSKTIMYVNFDFLINGIMQCVFFCIWPLSLDIMCGRVLLVCGCISFRCPLYEYSLKFMCPFSCWCICGLLTIWGHYEQWCEHSYIVSWFTCVKSFCLGRYLGV